MTVPANLNRVDYTGTGSAGPFTVPFPFYDASHLTVLQTDALFNQATLTGWTATGAGGPSGAVTLAAACPVGSTLTIMRIVPLTQITSIKNQEAFYPEVHEQEMDLLAMADQQLDEAMDRTLRLPAGMSGVDMTLPRPDPGHALVWNAAGDGLENAGSASATLQQDLADSADVAKGDEMIAVKQPFAGAVARTQHDKNAEWVSVLDFGADPTGVTFSHTHIQNAINSDPGILHFPSGIYLLNDEIILTKPIKIIGDGPGSWPYLNGKGSVIKQTNLAKSIFKLTASKSSYAFDQYGFTGLIMEDIGLSGVSMSNRAAYGICCDTSVNSGDYHVRECVFKNVNFLYLTEGINFTGIAYLNDFFNCSWQFCDYGFTLLKGTASDRGGQTRFFGCTWDLLTETCVRLNLDTTSGDFAFYGCTMADSKIGLACNEESSLTVSGCSFEHNQNVGEGCGILCKITSTTNPNSQGNKMIVGNKFLYNDASIHIDKTTASFLGGGEYWPMLVDCNAFGDATALRISVQPGQTTFGNHNFVLGASNSGSGSSGVLDSQISSLFSGADYRGVNITRIKNKDKGQLFSHSTSSTGNTYLGSVSVPDGMSLRIPEITQYGIDTSTGVRSNIRFTAKCDLNTDRISRISANTGYNLIWTNTTGSTRVVRLISDDYGSAKPYFINFWAYVE